MPVQTLITFTPTECARCGVQFAVTEGFDKRRRNDGQDFYCPNGHNLTFGKSEADRLREKLATEKRQAEFWRTRKREAEQEAEHQKRLKAAAKGQLTKLKKKVANGVCPAPGCKRHFDNLQQHIATEHPDLMLEPVAE